MTFTVRRLMAAVAVLGLILAAFRAHFSLGSFVAGVLSIAWIETGREARRREAAGAAVGPLAAVELFAHSAAMAAVTLVGSMIPVVVMSPLLTPRSGCVVYFPDEVLFVTVPLCIYATIRVARRMQREFGWGRVIESPATGTVQDAGRTPADGAGITRVEAEGAGPARGEGSGRG